MSGGPGVAERCSAIGERIAAACARCGRRPDEVTVVGASKQQPVERLLAAWRAGIRVFGENRVQEALAKRPQLPDAAEWHLIGPLQSNKARSAVDAFAVVQSVDRRKIAEVLDREARRARRILPVFLEVNLGGEETKHGFAARHLAAATAPLVSLANLRVVGLMAIPPLADDPEAMRPWFRRLRELRDELVARPEGAGCPGLLSMGMSGDYEVAVEEGATHVRIGTALFGPRDGEEETG
jgi:hypothetical protein